MLTRQINSYMKGNRLWQHCTPACHAAFIRAMRGNRYGKMECIDAMIWFVEGWKAADITRLRDTCSQVNSEQHKSESVPDSINMPIGEPDDSYL